MLTKTYPHTFIRNGYYYFSRRVPSDLRDHYSYHRIVQGLRTTSPQKAKVQASITSAKVEAYWNQVRLAKSDVIGMSLVRDTSISSLKVGTKQSQSDCPSLLDALEVYLEQKGDFSRDKSLIVVCALLIPTIREQLTPSVFAFN